MNKSTIVIKHLVGLGFVPESGSFTISKELIDLYQLVYKSLYEKNDSQLKSSNKSYARKLAGVFLMKESLSRDNATKITNKKLKNNNGIIYVVSNPSFPNCYKIGITKNLHKRLQNYQTYDPFRAYKVEHYRFVENAPLVEKQILETLKLNLVKGEWLRGNIAIKYFLDKVQNL
jgi:hypothetical protein